MSDLSFNLVDRPWLPCIEGASGRLTEVGIRDALVWSHELRALACESPLHDAAVITVLLAILHQCFGPRDEYAWSALYKQGCFSEEAIDGYLNRCYNRFDLFASEHPFYQSDDPRVKPKSVIHLIHSFGNTGAVFHHQDEKQGLSLTPAQAARALITAQGFRTAGLSGLQEKFTDGTLTRGVLFFAEGSTLFETLILNLVAYPQPQYFPFTSRDAPAWEQENPDQLRDTPHGYLDYLTWQSNRIRLLPTFEGDQIVVRELTIGPGLKLSDQVFSPLKLYQLRGKGDEARWQRRDFSEDRALWRDYETLFAFDSDVHRPPVVLQWLHGLAAESMLPKERAYHVRTQGLLADQAKPVFYRDQVMPIPDLFLRDAFYIRALEAARDNAERVEYALKNALAVFATNLLQRSGERDPDKNDVNNLIKHWGVLTNYWTRLEPHYWAYLGALPHASDSALGEWNDTLKLLARQLLEEMFAACGSTHGSERAETRASYELNKRLKAIFDPAALAQKGKP